MDSPQTPYTQSFSRARAYLREGRFTDALQAFQNSARIAAAENQVSNEAKAELGIAGTSIRLFRYREALEHSDRALQLAVSINDETTEGGAVGDIATVYHAVGDMQSAVAAAEKSVALLANSPRRDFFVMALLNTADIDAALGRQEASLSFLKRAIAVAHSINQPNIEASAQEHLGEMLIGMHDFAGASVALKEARRLQVAAKSADLGVTDKRLAELDFLNRDYAAALREIRALEISRSPALATLIPWELPNLKGKVLLAVGRRREALAAFQQAVDFENQRRRDVLPADMTSIQTVVSAAEAYTDYVQLAASLAVQTHDRLLARKAFEVLVANRAWTLRDEVMSQLRRQWKLPPEYYQLLNQIQDLQARVTLGGDSKELRKNKSELERVRLALIDLENKSLLEDRKFSVKNEKDAHKTSLSDIQSRLGTDELLCSFFLGTDQSFEWILTKERMDIVELPATKTIAADAHAFAQAVRTGTSSADSGLRLTDDLFGHLPPAAARKKDWLLTLDDALLEGVPLSALPSPGNPGGESLILAHSIRVLAAEALLTSPEPAPAEQLFVGVADPIYNRADSRRKQGLTLVSLRNGAAPVSLARLAGSDREVRKSAVSSALPQVVILTGSQASAAGVRAAFASGPEVVHFAVHVVSPEENGVSSSDQAGLALSLTSAGVPELLTKENIASLNVPGSLIVLSGCFSEQGEVLPGAGLVGLSRAWLLAGASAVLVTAWPTPDDSGQFFQSFYAHFHRATGNMGQRASAALQAAQAEMEASSGYRSKPSFWAAYSLISKE